MLRGNAAFEQAITGSHDALVKAEAFIAGRRVAELPLSSGSINVDRSSFVRRSANLTFQEDYSRSAGTLGVLLAQPGCEVRVWRGVRAAGVEHWLPVHWGMSSKPVISWRERTIRVTSPDLADRVVRDRFLRPRRTAVGMTHAQQIQTLVRESIPRAGFVDESQDGTAVADAVFEEDRDVAISKLATDISCDTYLRPDGRWVLRRVASTISVPDLRFREGVALTDASLDVDWSQVFNAWSVQAERGDGLTLVGIDEDLDPLSPTYVNGPMGRNTGYYRSSTLTTSAQCAAAATTLRYRAQGARVGVDYSGLLHPGVEAGDRHDVIFDGQTYRLIVDSFNFDLLSGQIQAQGRSATNLGQGLPA